VAAYAPPTARATPRMLAAVVAINLVDVFTMRLTFWHSRSGCFLHDRSGR
jgi:hypothetical protein